MQECGQVRWNMEDTTSSLRRELSNQAPLAYFGREALFRARIARSQTEHHCLFSLPIVVFFG